MEKFPQCAICGTQQQLLRCAKCKTVFYCSAAHQHMDWPNHKKFCRMLAKQRSNSRIQHIPQAVAQTTLNKTNEASKPVMTSEVDAGYESWSTSINSMGIIGFGFLGGSESAEVDPSILTAVPPMDVMMGNNESSIIHQSDVDSTSPSTRISDAGRTARCTTILPNNTATNNTNLLPQYHHVDQRLLSPQYHQQQHQLMQQQLQRPQIPPPDENYSQITSLNNHNAHHHYEKSFSCQVGSGGGVDEIAFGNANERRYDELCRNIINDMNQYGLSVVDDFLGVEKGLQILNEVHRMYAAGVFKDGQLVNNLREEQVHTIRGDKITWVKGVEPGCANVGYLINQIDAVICRANAMKNNGQLGNYNIKERTKAMVACYPGSGSHYVVHVDNPNKDGRVITAIYYLNVNWDTERSGGVLRIFPEHGNSVADIEPKFDRLIFFWSDRRNPHEVQPSHRTRYAITVWYFDANEREAALNRIKNNESNTKVATTKTTINKNQTTSTTGITALTNIHDNKKDINRTPNTNIMDASATILSSQMNESSIANTNTIINNIKCTSIGNATENINSHTNSNKTNVNENVSCNTLLTKSSEICT